MSQEMSNFPWNWRDWRTLTMVFAAFITAGVGCWALISAAWATMDLPAPVVLTSKYEKEQRERDQKMSLLISTTNTVVYIMGSYQEGQAKAELREVDRQIAINQGKPDILKLLGGQRDSLETQIRKNEAQMRKLMIPEGM